MSTRSPISRASADGPLPCVCSPHGRYVARVESGRRYLSIYELRPADQGAVLARSIELHPAHRRSRVSDTTTAPRRLRSRESDPAASARPSQAASTTLRWSAAEQGDDDSTRLLICTGNHVSVVDLKDEEWSAEATLSELSAIAHVAFGGTRDSLLVFSELDVELHIWLLAPLLGGGRHASSSTCSSVLGGGRHLVVKSPKPPIHSFSIRARTGHIALLTRQETTDVLSILDPVSYAPLVSLRLQTVDAQGVMWSPDGAWIVVWDTATLGTKLVVCTAEGMLHKMYVDDAPPELAGAAAVPDRRGGLLGVTRLRWSDDSRYLCLAMGDGSVRVLESVSLRLVVVSQDPTQLGSVGRAIFLEQADPPNGGSTYALAPERDSFPVALDPSSTLTVPDMMVELNSSGTLVATVDSRLSNVVCVWSTRSSQGLTADLVGALVRRSPIERIAWHPALSRSDYLMIWNEHSTSATVHLWDMRSQQGPQILRVSALTCPGDKGSHRHTLLQDARWLHRDGQTDTEDMLWVSLGNQWVVGRVQEGTPGTGAVLNVLGGANHLASRVQN